MLITLSLIWGGSFFFGRIAVLELPPLTVAFFRVFLAAIALWVFLLVSGRRMPGGGSFLSAIIIMSILNNIIPFSMILYGQQELGSGLASVVNAMTPIWTLLIANFATSDEKFSANKIVGIVLGFVGVGILMSVEFGDGLSAPLLAQMAILVATISYGFAGVWGKRFKGQDPIHVATGQLTASTLLLLPLMLFLEQPWQLAMPSTNAVVSIIMLAVLCTSIAYVLYFAILSSAGATNVSLVTFLVPVSGILLGVLFLDERFTTIQILGSGLIGLGLVAIDGRLLKTFSK